MNSRIAIGLLILAGLLWATQKRDQPSPLPPEPPAAIDLTGAFQGPDAAEDAATVAAMSAEIAALIEWDGQQEQPSFNTGRAFDVLRTRIREFMCRGESLGEKHPAVRQIVGSYLDEQLGNGGGELPPDQRAKWVKAYREIARAARHAIAQ